MHGPNIRCDDRLKGVTRSLQLQVKGEICLTFREFATAAILKVRQRQRMEALERLQNYFGVSKP